VLRQFCCRSSEVQFSPLEKAPQDVECQTLSNWSPGLKSSVLPLTFAGVGETWITKRQKKPSPLKRLLFFHSRRWVWLVIDPNQTFHMHNSVHSPCFGDLGRKTVRVNKRVLICN
jgi:hypothetical protein